MKPCLVDLNVLLGLLTVRHTHHHTCRAWFADLYAGQARMCRLVQLGLVRLLANRTIMRDDALSPLEGWRTVESLLEDERLGFQPDSTEANAIMPRYLRGTAASGKVVNDAYLAALAVSGSMTLVTLDKGFRNFDGLDLLVLA
jgi:toxin-antitoxin system PIN domain toxin